MSSGIKRLDERADGEIAYFMHGHDTEKLAALKEAQQQGAATAVPVTPEAAAPAPELEARTRTIPDDALEGTHNSPLSPLVTAHAREISAQVTADAAAVRGIAPRGAVAPTPTTPETIKATQTGAGRDV